MARVEIHLPNREVFTIIDDRSRRAAIAEETQRLQTGGSLIVHRSRPPVPLRNVDLAQLGARVRSARKARHWSQVELARRLSRSESWVSQIERGARRLDRLSVLELLAQTLDVSTSDLAASDDMPAGAPDDVVIIPTRSVYYLKVSES